MLGELLPDTMRPMRQRYFFEACSKIDLRDSGVVSTLAWRTHTGPAEIGGIADDGDAENIFQPPSFGPWFGIVDFPPGAPGFMHRTDTIDCAVYMEGEIEMELDN